jgi:hypothetical protein
MRTKRHGGDEKCRQHFVRKAIKGKITWDTNIKIGLTEMGFEGVDSIKLS